mgnify:CR=1 FL=1
MRARARDRLRDFCRVACRYATSVTATVNSGSSHSSGRREHIGKEILRQGVLLVASPVAVLAEPALEHTHSGTHLPRLLTSLTPSATHHVLAVVPADTNLIGATAGVTDTVIGERLGAVNPPCACPLLSVCCLRESQARLRAILRVRAPPMALSRRPVRAACGYVRLVERGESGEVCGRDARASGWRAEAPDISVFMWAYLGTP